MRDDDVLRGIVLRGGGAREVVGDAKISFELEPEWAIEIDADLFSQVNRAQNLRLVATAPRCSICSAARAISACRSRGAERASRASMPTRWRSPARSTTPRG